MKKIYLIIVVSMMLPLFSCHDTVEQPDTPTGNFEMLWTTLDEHYCFFNQKDVNWQEVHDRYAKKVSDDMTGEELFRVCAEMLKELKDGHTNLISSFDTSRYWIWEQYPQNYDERLIDEYYLKFDYRRTSGIDYRILENNVAYMRYSSFSATIGEGNLDNILSTLALADGLIIDVRNNGGGILTNAETLVARFINERLLAGYISHKTGPAHNEFSTPYDYYIDPAEGRIHWNKPVVILTNRSTYSAANNFVSIMKQLPNVKVVGDTTGGGCGMPFTSELPNGWSVRFSAAPIYDAQMQLTEFGVEPSEECKVDMEDSARTQGIDTIIEKAFSVLKEMIQGNK